MRANTAKPRPVVVTEALIRRHQVGLWRYLRFLGASAEVAEDLVQETFVALWEAGLEDHGVRALSRWLRTTARNRLVAERRKVRPELENLEFAEVDAAFEQWAGDDGATDAYRAALDACVATLSDDEQRMLETHYGEARESRTGLAEKLGVGVEGLKSRLRRVKARLRACIERRLES